MHLEVLGRGFSSKTSNAMRKRFRLTASGKLKHKLCGNNHKAGSKNRKRHNRLRDGGFLTPTYTDNITPYLGKATKA